MAVKSSNEIGVVTVADGSLVAKLQKAMLVLYSQAKHIAISSRYTMVDFPLPQQVNDSAKVRQNVAGQTAVSADQTCVRREETFGVMSRLEKSSNMIDEIISQIEKMTDLTKLLVLNVAIKAARAGETGREFTMVMEEINNLIGTTSVSTQQISTNIRAIQKDIQGVISSLEQRLRSDHDRIGTTSVSTQQISTNIRVIQKDIQGVISSIEQRLRSDHDSDQATTILGQVHESVVTLNSKLTDTKAHWNHK